MEKEKLIELFEKVGIPFSEGILSDDDTDNSEHIVFWDYIWEPISASGKSYSFNVTYQISFISAEPRNAYLLKLISLLMDCDCPVEVYHEYIAKNRQWHSYFSLEVVEDLFL